MLWLLWRQAETWGCKPSDILHVEDDWQAAYTIDQAVWNFGSALQAALDKAVDNPKMKDKQRKRAQEKVFSKWLPGGQADTSRFRDPTVESLDGGIRR